MLLNPIKMSKFIMWRKKVQSNVVGNNTEKTAITGRLVIL